MMSIKMIGKGLHLTSTKLQKLEDTTKKPSFSKRDRIKLIDEDLEERLRNEGFRYIGAVYQEFGTVEFNPNQYRLNPLNIHNYDLRFVATGEYYASIKISSYFFVYARKRPLDKRRLK